MADGWWDCRSCCTVCMMAEMNSDAHHLHTSIRWNREHDTSNQYRTVLMCLRQLFLIQIAQINHGTLWKTMTSPKPPRCSPIDAHPKNAAFLSIRWGYFLPVKMPYGFGQWNLLHPARETKGFLWGAPGIANCTQVDMNFIDKHVQFLALWELTIWYTAISDWWFIIEGSPGKKMTFMSIYVSCLLFGPEFEMCLLCWFDDQKSRRESSWGSWGRSIGAIQVTNPLGKPGHESMLGRHLVRYSWTIYILYIAV